MENTTDDTGAPETEPQPAGDEPAVDTGSAEIEQLRAELAARDAHIGKLNDESAKRRKEAKAAKEAEAVAAAEAGDLRPMVEGLNARLAELDPKAQRADRLEQYIAGQVEERAKALPKEWQARLERFADPIERLDLISLYETTVAQSKAPTAPAPREASAPAAPSSTGTDWDSLVIAGGAPLERAIAADPEGFAAYQNEALGGQKNGNTFRRLFGG